jgi:hypothetical protein
MMQDVELVDVAEDSRAPGRARPAAGADPHDPHDPEHPHRRRWLVVAVTVALVVGGVVSVGRAAPREAVPATVVPAGMVAPLDGPPWSRWTVPVPRSDDLLAATGVLVSSSIREGRFHVTAWDVETGDQAWEQDLGPVSGNRPLTGCPQEGGDVGDLVVCVVEPPVVVGEGWSRGTAPFPAPDDRWARVFAISASTGEVRSTFTVFGRLGAIERLGDDVVVMTVAPDGHARVARYAAEGGRLRWWHRASEPLRLREGIVTGSEMRVTEEFVLVQGWSALVLDAQDGTEMSSSPPTWLVLGGLSGDLFGTWTGGRGGVVHDRDGRELFTSRALFPGMTATDGQPDDVLVLDSGSSLMGRALPSGAELWRYETYRAARLQVDGRLVLLGVDGYQVLDVRTGELEWESPFRVLMWWAPLTDGELVLAAGRAGDGSTTIEARQLDDGELAWVYPLPEGARSVEAIGGHLLVRTRDDLTLLE